VGNSILHLAIPPQVVIELGALITTLAHFLTNVFNAYVEVNDPRFAAELNNQPAPTTVTQSGFANPVLLGLMALVVGSMLMLTGCASQLQALTAANTSAVVSVRAEADLRAKVAAESFCTMTVDTLARNVQYVRAVQDLCWAGSVTSPSSAAEVLVAPTGVNTLTIPAPVAVQAPTPAVTANAPVIAAPAAATPAQTAPLPYARRSVKPAAVVTPAVAHVSVPVAAPAVTLAPVATPAPTPVATSLLSTPVVP
jgi:hypothetical protein